MTESVRWPLSWEWACRRGNGFLNQLYELTAGGRSLCCQECDVNTETLLTGSPFSPGKPSLPATPCGNTMKIPVSVTVKQHSALEDVWCWLPAKKKSGWKSLISVEGLSFLLRKPLQSERREDRRRLLTEEAISQPDRLDSEIFTMSPLAPEAPTGPCGLREGEALRAMWRHFVHGGLRPEGGGWGGGLGGGGLLSRWNLQHKDWLCSVGTGGLLQLWRVSWLQPRTRRLIFAQSSHSLCFYAEIRRPLWENMVLQREVFGLCTWSSLRHTNV